MKNNKITYLFFAILTSLLICSCNISLPTSNTTSKALKPSIIFPNSNSEALIYVDGIKMGKVNNYSNKSLLLESGTHSLKIIENDKIIYNKKIFISGEEIRTINLK